MFWGKNVHTCINNQFYKNGLMGEVCLVSSLIFFSKFCKLLGILFACNSCILCNTHMKPRLGIQHSYFCNFLLLLLDKVHMFFCNLPPCTGVCSSQYNLHNQFLMGLNLCNLHLHFLVSLQINAGNYVKSK